MYINCYTEMLIITTLRKKKFTEILNSSNSKQTYITKVGPEYNTIVTNNSVSCATKCKFKTVRLP